jgi:succinyl-CoA synthetase beta subunit
MNKFNEVAQTVLQEEIKIDPRLGNVYRQVSDLLSKKGLKAHEYEDVMDVVQKAIKLAFNEGYKASESNPFRK